MKERNAMEDQCFGAGLHGKFKIMEFQAVNYMANMNFRGNGQWGQCGFLKKDVLILLICDG